MAIKGGGLYLFNSTLSSYNLCARHTSISYITVKFIQNSADKGGAVYSYARGLKEICIFQQPCYNTNMFDPLYTRIWFVEFFNNSATESGVSMFSAGQVECAVGYRVIEERLYMMSISNIEFSDYESQFL